MKCHVTNGVTDTQTRSNATSYFLIQESLFTKLFCFSPGFFFGTDDEKSLKKNKNREWKTAGLCVRYTELSPISTNFRQINELS